MEQKNRIEGKNSSLNDSRLERLQAIDFRWAKRKGQASWDEKFVSLHLQVLLVFVINVTTDAYLLTHSYYLIL